MVVEGDHLIERTLILILIFDSRRDTTEGEIMSMFSFFSNKSPGASNLAANGSSASFHEGEESKSSFSFMSGAAPTDQETIPQESSSSGKQNSVEF